MKCGSNSWHFVMQSKRKSSRYSSIETRTTINGTTMDSETCVELSGMHMNIYICMRSPSAAHIRGTALYGTFKNKNVKIKRNERWWWRKIMKDIILWVISIGNGYYRCCCIDGGLLFVAGIVIIFDRYRFGSYSFPIRFTFDLRLFIESIIIHACFYTRRSQDKMWRMRDKAGMSEAFYRGDKIVLLLLFFFFAFSVIHGRSPPLGFCVHCLNFELA